MALPLEAINRESAREKSIRHGHPSTLHLWWSRKPLATCRAVLFAQLVDDPSAHPDRFPTQEAQEAERDRLHDIIKRLVIWENTRDEKLLAEAQAEIVASCDGNPPPILDPFAGGGSIPLEAQRLGLEAHASDLNPVAVLINKALIEIPPKFRDKAPVYPDNAETRLTSRRGAEGLAADVRAYGQWMRDEAERRIGHHYPKAALPDGTKANVIAWKWARTVTCPNPGCGIDMPLVSSWWLSKKKGKEAYVVPAVIKDPTHPSGRRVQYAVAHGSQILSRDGSMSGRKGATCISCDSTIGVDYVKTESAQSRMGADLIAVVSDGLRQRVYLSPTDEHVKSAQVDRPIDVPDQELGHDPRNLWTPAYGLTRFCDLFTSRQLLALTTFSDLVGEARERALKDTLSVGMLHGDRLEAGGTDAEAYADTIATYLSLSVSRCTDYWSSLCSWHSSREIIRNTFARQAIPMVWDYAEAMPFSSSSGGFSGQLDWVVKALQCTPATIKGAAEQHDAATYTFSGIPISTDPPYYDNIGYSDLSDFFYVWLRRSLKDIHTKLFGTLLVPKVEELVANPYRHGGKGPAKRFFEDGFRAVFARVRESAWADLPITVYYAYKQSESGKEGETSTGWETLLNSMIRSQWSITATWPVRSELSNRMLAKDTNSLASSIVLTLRPRPDNAPTIDRRGFIAALQQELPAKLRDLQHGMIAPVDLRQAAIGPGMAVFSRYSSVLEPDGSPMRVGAALARINEVLDEVLSEQEGDFDSATRFAIEWYRQHGYEAGKFGDADNMAHARNTAVAALDRVGILTSRAGKVTLVKPSDLPATYDPMQAVQVSVWEAAHHMIRTIDSGGVGAAGEILNAVTSRPGGGVDAALVKELAFLLYRIADDSKWSQDALAFNTLATSWSDITDAAQGRVPSNEQTALDFDEEDD
ncbi:DUF1156 domain-containing protein [Catenuloplanes japonicus]|uniref:DUF1156 domain-containing protein n=1 Tax=Catenuloplanes japonicus TaxID=33876 RepID=UPI0018DCB2A9|nr:DUF1156 domain-containing protein [Catenuloplanes japonicus]